MQSMDLLGKTYEADMQAASEAVLNWLRVAPNEELVKLILEYLDIGEFIEKGLASIDCI